MENEKRSYIAIDLKSFYASVECVERGLDPLTTLLIVADAERTEKTICLAVSPALKAYGIPGRARLFEVVQQVQRVNRDRTCRAPGQKLTGSSWNQDELSVHPELALDYLVAKPRMALYIKYSTCIYECYLKYVAPEDIHVYSIDEVLMDVTDYLPTYGLTAEELARKMIYDVLERTGITATAGIGTNLYLCKIAMDIVAKKMQPDAFGVRVASLDEDSYRRLLWDHRPLTDFWRVGPGTARKLEEHGMYTMGDVARCSVGRTDDYWNEELLYRLFGVNAELLIDHAWGWEPCTMEQIKAYRPENNSICSGQVLQSPYAFEKAEIIVREMAEALALDLVDKGLLTDQIVLTVGYDAESLTNPAISRSYRGAVSTDHYGRCVPKHAQGTVNFDRPLSSGKRITGEVIALYRHIVNPKLLVRRITLSANHLLPVTQRCLQEDPLVQMDLFGDCESQAKAMEEETRELEKERRMQKTVLNLQKRFGKNMILRGTDLQEGATAMERNSQIGGHKA